MLTIALEDGFDGDRVIVAIGGDVVIDEPAVRTDHRIGLGFAVDVPLPDRPVTVEVDVPTRAVHATYELPTPTDTSVGISLADDRLTFRTSQLPFGYA